MRPVLITSLSLIRILLGFVLGGLLVPGVLAFDRPAHKTLPDVDKRTGEAKPPKADSKQEARLRKLRSSRVDVQVDFHSGHGSPQWIRRASGVLVENEPIVAGGGAAGLHDGARAIRAFVAENSELFGHGPEALTTATGKRQYTNSHNGVRTFSWEQRLDDIPVFNSIFIGNVNGRGDLINISSTFVPSVNEAADAGTPNRAALEANPPIAVERAIVLAAESLGEMVDLNDLLPLPPVSDVQKRQQFTSPVVPGEVDSKLVWLPLTPSLLRLCWQIELTRHLGGERYQLLVDVQNGDILVRRCLTIYAADATFRVFTGDSPTPLSPGHSIPLTNQPPTVARELVTVTALYTNASPLGWINEGDNQTRGNNVDAHLDRNGDDVPDLPRPQGSPYRTFDFPMDLGQRPSAYPEASAVQLFYWCNWMHDQLYQLGFDEAAGNFQKDNFGRGGAGNDYVLADSLDGAGVNNANFTPTDDGVSPRIQMFLFDGPAPARDGDLDAEIVLHEYTHGLSTRLVGGGAGIDALQTAGMGEGWSDFYALALLSQETDDLSGTYAMGAYATFGLGGLTENYYYGIRRYPYCIDLAKNPLTFKDMDPSQAVGHPGAPISPINPFNPLFADEVHAQGEIWCVTLWDARANLIRKHGFARGNRLILQLVTDGMKLGPANPNFLQARDAILLADEINNSGLNAEELWAAFAKRGMGFSAKSPSSSTTIGLVEAFDLPDKLSILPSGGISASGPVGGPLVPHCFSYFVTNRSSNAITWSVLATQSWISLSVTQATLRPFSATNVTACLTPSTLSFTQGLVQQSLMFSNHISGIVQTREIQLSVFSIAQLPFVDGFETGTMDPHWLATGTGDFRTEVSPNDGPHAGSFHLTMDSFGSGNFARNELTLGLDLAGYTNVMLRFWAKSFGDEPDGPPAAPFIQGADFDGLAISQDGIAWYEVQGLRSLRATNTQYTVALDAAIASLGLGYNETFRIRFNHYDNSGIPFDGIALDDISIIGDPVYRLSLSAPAAVAESGGTLTNSAVVALGAVRNVDTVAQLVSSDPFRLRVPSTVIIPAGSLSAGFDLLVLQDTFLNGSSAVAVSAFAAGYRSALSSVLVNDDESARLSLRLPSRLTEGQDAPRRAGKVKLSRTVNADVRVSLFSSDPAALSVPAFVVVAAGNRSADFDMDAGEDSLLTGTRSIRITAHVQNWIDDSANVTVFDNDIPGLAFKLPARLSEGNGTVTNIGQVQLSGIVSSNVEVRLVSRAAAQLTVPASVIVPAGQTNVPFSITIVDDTIVNGLRTVAITASAGGFAAATGLLGIIDDETPPTPYQPFPPDKSAGIAINTTLSWQAGFGELLVNGGFENGDFSGWRVENIDYGSFYLNDGKFDPEGAENPTAPYTGKFSVVTSQIGSGTHLLYQDVTIPELAKAVRLSWVDKVRNYADRFIPFTQDFRVEIRDLSNNLLSTIFVTKPGDKLLGDWVQRSFDISQFRGQSIRIAFVEQDLVNYFNLHLDDISLFVESSGTTTFDVRFGTNTVFAPSDSLGATSNAHWTLPTLALNTGYYWQIVERRGAAATTGPVWQFTTRGVGAVDHFEWSSISNPQSVGEPFSVTLKAKDDIGNVVTGFSGPVQVSGVSSPEAVSPVVITEIDTGSNDSIEFQNVSSRAIDISGWKISTWDRGAWPLPRVTVTLPSNTICPARAVFQLFRQGAAPGAFPSFFAGTNFLWNNAVVGNPLAILLRDASDGLVDFVCGYGADPAQIKTPSSIPHHLWLGEAFAASTNGLLTFQRVGSTDRNTAADWIATTNSIGRQNDSLVLPFSPRNSVSLNPPMASIVSGSWTGQVAVQGVVSNVALLAEDPEGNFGLSSRFDVGAADDLSITVAYDPDLTIPGDPVRYTVTVKNAGPTIATGVLLTNRLPENTAFVSANASQGFCELVNGVISCPLGTLEAESSATVVAILTSTRPGSLTNVFGVSRAEPESYLPNNIVSAVSTATLPLIAVNDVTVSEGNTGTKDAIFTVRLSARSAIPVSVEYSTSNRTATAGLDYIAASGTIVFPPGSTNQPLVVRIIGDSLYEFQETVDVNLFSPVNGAIIDSLGLGRITDDDSQPTLRIADTTITEPGPGEMANAILNVTLSAPSGLPVSVNYYTTNGIAIPEKDYLPQAGTVIMLAGTTNAQINIPIMGDKNAESNEFFFVNLYTPLNAFLFSPLGRCTIIDNGYAELDHFAVSGWPSPQYAGVPFVASFSAQDARNNPLSSFAGRVSINALLPRPEVTIGASTSVWANPFAALYHDARSQIIYRADELGGPGNLSGLSLFVTAPPGQTLSNWTIRLKHSGASRYPAPAWESNGWTTAYRNHETIASTGWVSFIFATPFAYDGRNNLLVDFSFNNSSFSSDGAVRYHLAPENRTLHFRTDSAFGDPLEWRASTAPAPLVTNAVPNIRFLREDLINLAPSFSDDFVDGSWSGLVTVSSPGTNVLVRIADGAGHFGSSGTFVVESNADVDADGLPDSWQIKYFAANGAGRGPNDDPDGDGFSNYQEFRAGTDPLNGNSAIRISEIRIFNHDVSIRFQTLFGKAYRLERSVDPAGGLWVPVASFVPGTGGPAQIVDPSAGSLSNRFYRVRLLQ